MSARRAATTAPARKPAKRSNISRGSGLAPYLSESQRPIVILAFLLPAVLIYEFGVRMYPTGVAAVTLFQRLAQVVNVYGPGVAPILLILTLLVWHLTKHDRWQFRLRTLGGMLLESILFAIPVFAIGLICHRSLELTVVSTRGLGALWVLSIGAGVYEELLFRFYGCGVLNLLFAKGFRLPPTVSMILVVAVSSILFSLYHYLGPEHFSVISFTFRALAGAYFAALFMHRGLGVTAGAHAIYDLIVVTFR